MTQRLIDEGIDPSVGSVGDAYDALAETTVGSFKNELIRRQGPWRDVDHVEVQTLQWVHWFNTERPHEYLDELTPAQAGTASLRSASPGSRRVTHETESPDMPGGLIASSD